MGGGSSHLVQDIKQDPSLLDAYREELVNLFTKEYASSIAQGLSEDDARERFMAVVRQEEIPILCRATETSSSPSQRNGSNKPVLSYTELLKKHSECMRKKHSHKFLCCVDGSEGGDMAFKTMVHIMKDTDKVVMFNAFCESDLRKLLPAYQPEHIRQKYQAQLIGLHPESNVRFHFEDMGTSGPLEALRGYLDDYDYLLHSCGLSERSIYSVDYSRSQYPTDFVLLGYTGRRGRKDDSTTMGSLTDRALRSIHVPCIICKTPGRPKRATPYHYMMAVDDSSESERGMEILSQLIRRTDSLTLIHVADPQVKPRPPSLCASDRDTSDHPELVVQQDQWSTESLDGSLVAATPKSPQPGCIPCHEKEEIDRRWFDSIPRYAPCSSDKSYIGHTTVIEMYPGVGEDVKDVLVKCANEMKPDFFALAPRAQSNLTSITEHVISLVQCSVILCRN